MSAPLSKSFMCAGVTALALAGGVMAQAANPQAPGWVKQMIETGEARDARLAKSGQAEKSLQAARQEEKRRARVQFMRDYGDIEYAFNTLRPDKLGGLFTEDAKTRFGYDETDRLYSLTLELHKGAVQKSYTLQIFNENGRCHYTAVEKQNDVEVRWPAGKDGVTRLLGEWLGKNLTATQRRQLLKYADGRRYSYVQALQRENPLCHTPQS